MHADYKGVKFEDNIQIIDEEISKRQRLWNLSSIRWIDWQDVAQIVRIHIYKKWKLIDMDKPLRPYLNKVIGNQIKNLIRNVYGNYVRPCLRCCASEGESFCQIYKTQSSKCPLYLTWESGKKLAYEIKMPVSIDGLSNTQEVAYKDEQDIEDVSEIVHKKMRHLLKPNELTVYESLFIHHKSEEETAKKMGFRSSETGRKAGYKQIKNIRKSIVDKFKRAIKENEIDIL